MEAPAGQDVASHVIKSGEFDKVIKPKGRRQAIVGKLFIEVCASFLLEREMNCTATPS